MLLLEEKFSENHARSIHICFEKEWQTDKMTKVFAYLTIVQILSKDSEEKFGGTTFSKI